MNILYHHRTKSRDGQAVHIRELIAALRGRGHAVEEWALSSGDAGAMGSEGGWWGRLLSMAPRGAYELAEHAYGPMVSRRLVQAGRRVGAEVLYERHALNNTAGVRASRRLGVPLLLEVNSPLAHERSEHESLALPRWAQATERAVLRQADRILAVTRVLGDMLVELGVDAERVHVAPNGVDLSHYPERPAREDEALVVGFVGFFRPWHHIESLVDLLAGPHMPDRARLLLVGDGPSRSAIEARAAARGVRDRVEVTGAVGREAIPGHVRSMDICVQPAATAWASPLKLFEYMGAGAAIVAPDQPNLREVLTDGHDALLFAPDEPGAMAQAVERLGGDAALRGRLGRSARETVVSRGYTWDAAARRVEQAAVAAGAAAP